MTEHTVLKSITLIPRNERAKVEIDRSNDGYDEFTWGELYRTGPDECTLKWVSSDFDVKYELGPSVRKQKLLDAGFSDRKSEEILDALGEL